MTFTINVDNNITVLDSTEKIEERQEGTEIFSSSQELDALAGKWPGFPDLLGRPLQDLVLEPIRFRQILPALLHLDRDLQVINPNDMIRKLNLAILLDLKPVRSKR